MDNSIDKSRNYKEECIAYMSEVGLTLDREFVADGKIHRYSADENKHKLDEWYVAHEGVFNQGNEYFVCTFGSWSEDTKYEYKSFDSSMHKYDEAEIKEIRDKEQILHLKVEQERRVLHVNAAKKAQNFWEGYSTNPPSDEYLRYLELKGINPFGGVKFGFNPQGYPSIIVPLRNVDGGLRSLQYISLDADGKSYKSFLSGGEKRGNYHLIGKFSDDENVIFVGEGYATCVSIYEAIKKPVAVAFDAGNMEAVVENLRREFPKKSFIIAADNDEVGMRKAQAVSVKFGCFVVIPQFPSKQKAGTDFNDLVKVAGLDEVRHQLTLAYAKSDAGKKVARKYFSRDEDPCKCFKLSKLPPQLREYIHSICQTTSAHPIMITASVLSMASAYFGTKVVLPEGEYFQPLYPNLWILCIAKSGQFKTTALNKGAKIAFENQSKVFKAIKEIREDAQEGDTDIEGEVLKVSIQNVVLPTKITAEAFLEYVSQGHEGAIFASEFGGWLQNLDKTHNNDFKAIMTETYDVPTFYRYKTKTQGDCVLDRPYVSICGVSTISWVRANMKPTDVPSGFFARFIIFTPPFEDRIPPALPLPKMELHEAREKEFKEYFEEVLACIGEERAFTLSSEAKAVFHKYHVLIYCVPQICSDAVGELLQPYLKRWSPALLKIAMIIQLFLDPKKTEITAEAIMIAFHILNPAIRSTVKLFEGELGESAHQRKCRKLLNWIKKQTKGGHVVVKRRTVLSSKQLRGGVKEYDLVLQHLIEQGKVGYKEFSKKNDSEYFLVDEDESN